MGAVFGYAQPADTVSLKVEQKRDIVANDSMSFTIKQTNIRFKTISSITEIGALGNDYPHYGVIFDNTFVLSGDYSGSYKYLLVHALSQTSSTNKVKLDFHFANNISLPKKRLGRVVNVEPYDVQCSNWEKVSSTATMPRVVGAFHKMLSQTFDYKSTDKMALQQYENQINCILASKSLYAIVMDIDVKICTEHWMQQHRGYLLKMKQVDIDAVDEGIPCKGGGVFWITLEEKTTAKGNYRFQQKDANKIKGTMQMNELWNDDAIVHQKKYRIVFKATGNDFLYGWRDIFRTDSNSDTKIQFDKLTDGYD